MIETYHPKVAIIDYGLGNLFSIKRACEHAGMNGTITFDYEEILNADAVILPGVGAYGSAMEALAGLGLIELLRDIARSEKLLVGICLGMQLLLSVSYEFGANPGLDIIKGSVVRFEKPMDESVKLKVPQVGWNRVLQEARSDPLFAGISDGAFMYFVHSFYVRLDEPDVALATTKYGNVEFCSALRRGNVFGCQFHPERSGLEGLKIYRNMASIIQEQKAVKKESHA